MVFFSVWFNIPATRLYGLHSVWMGTPNIQRSRIRKARHFIFFPVYESLFLQACTRITRAAPQKFRPQRDVAVVGVGWRREGGQNRANNFLKKNLSRHILSCNPFIFVEKEYDP